MAWYPVEWVLAIYYGPSAHRATYGRLDGRDTKYTKDYIQLSRKREFLQTVSRLFPVAVSGDGSVPLTYQWPAGTTPGAFVFTSADRPHLKWETSLGAPKAWRMLLAPGDTTAETIPGDPSHLDFVSAERELTLLAKRGAGQPYLLAIKLQNEPRKLHLRAYLADADKRYSWADLKLVPPEIYSLAKQTTQRRALSWQTFNSGGSVPSTVVTNAISVLSASSDPMEAINAFDEDTARALLPYLRQPAYGLFFDPLLNHDAWIGPAPLPEQLALLADDLIDSLNSRIPQNTQDDALAETMEADPGEVVAFRHQIENDNFHVADSTSTTKTRGSAQRAFAEAVKRNYEFRCAITGIETRDFLVAAHIVPWSKDQTIRLDPSNGICLSLILDRAFEKGYVIIANDGTIEIDRERVGGDDALRQQLELYEGRKIFLPTNGAPKPEYLQRRRTIVGNSN
ncbi:MAG: HNH endonuclease [Verrucomicrobiota bacterium]